MTFDLRHSIYCTTLTLSLLASGCGNSADSEPSSSEKELPGEICREDSDCDDGIFCNGEESCEPLSGAARDDGCVGSAPPCYEGQTCDEAKESCQTECSEVEDADGDGHAAEVCGGDDCDDANPGRFPGNTEICDSRNVDEDCDLITYGARDDDGDGYQSAACCNGTGDKQTCGTDCNDQENRIYPTAAELCDGVDNDCNGQVDDLVAESEIWYVDVDGDGFGDPEQEVNSCQPGLSQLLSALGNDCDDTDRDVNPAGKEVCDGLDNDCDGEIDEGLTEELYEDRDLDGHGDPARPVQTCVSESPGGTPYVALDDDCDDENRNVYPGALERCNAIDDDCDTEIDEGQLISLYPDADNDGFGDKNADPVSGCESRKGVAVDNNEDCDDDNRDINPNIEDDGCDGVDNDCDDEIDEQASIIPTWYPDADGDGYGTKAGALSECTSSKAGYSRLDGDCDDTRAETYPGAPELCDRRDNDCSGNSQGGGTGGIDTLEDVDDDGQSSADALCEGGFVKSDCNDNDGSVYVGAAESCDRIDSDCSRSPYTGVQNNEDADQDGFTTKGFGQCSGGFPKQDCDDQSSSIFPGQTEVCDGIDNDCNDDTHACIYTTHLDDDTVELLAAPELVGPYNAGLLGCSPNNESPTVATGIAYSVKSDGIYYGFSSYCSELTLGGSDGDANRLLIPQNEQINWPLLDRDGYSKRELHCPVGEVIIGFEVRMSGERMLNLGLRCARFTVGTAGAGSATSIGSVNAGTMTGALTIECSGGTFPRSLALRSFVYEDVQNKQFMKGAHIFCSQLMGVEYVY